MEAEADTVDELMTMASEDEAVVRARACSRSVSAALTRCASIDRHASRPLRRAGTSKDHASEEGMQRHCRAQYMLTR